MTKNLICGIAMTLITGMASAALVTSHSDIDGTGATVDGVLGTNEYGAGNTYSFTGAGTGFGGPIGTGTLYMNSDGANLYIGFQPGGNINNIAALYLNSRAGGFDDAGMSDTGDGSRRVLSDLTRDVVDTFPVSMSSLPDFGVAMGDFGVGVFELTGTSHNFVSPFFGEAWNSGSDTDFREISIPLATLGVAAGGTVEFFMGWCSDTNFNSNESIPASAALNGGSNPGQVGPSAGYENHHAFVVQPPASVEDWSMME